ncbi:MULTISPECIES: extracellular solute-binding protein [unclassified Mesorhizobium]|uniref:extracellular solute-binding protein n=1 Tax=unclassified Mesorhizobium TaxID=325217 RepID=UPI0015E35F62|nr:MULTISPECIES: extracellular solute-binding protein [unclassified Mesorhizobium]
MNTTSRSAYRPTRRDIFKTGLGVGVSLAAGTLTMPAIAQSKPDQLLVADGGSILRDAYTKAYYEPFTQKTGIKVVPQSYMGAAEIKAIVDNKAWGQGDVALTGTAEAAVVSTQGLAEKIDYGNIDRADFFDSMSSDDWFMTLVAASCLAWNTEKFPGDKAPKSWTDFFKKSGSFPGRRTLQKAATLTLDIAAIGDGVARDKLYPLDINRSIASLDRIRDDIVWWESGSQSQQNMVSGEADLGFLWNGRAQQLKDQGKPIDFTFQDAVLDGDAFVIPKGHPNAKWAHELAVVFADGKNQAKFTELLPYGAATKSGVALVSPARLAVTPTGPENRKVTVLQDFAWWAKNGEEAMRRFTEWTIG